MAQVHASHDLDTCNQSHGFKIIFIINFSNHCSERRGWFTVESVWKALGPASEVYAVMNRAIKFLECKT